MSFIHYFPLYILERQEKGEIIMTSIEKIMLGRMNVEMKKEKEMEKSIAVQQDLMRKIAELQQQLIDEQDRFKKQQEQFNNELSCYDHDLRYLMEKEQSKQKSEEFIPSDDSDK